MNSGMSIWGGCGMAIHDYILNYHILFLFLYFAVFYCTNLSFYLWITTGIQRTARQIGMKFGMSNWGGWV